MGAIMNLKTLLGLGAVAVLAIATFQFTNATQLNAATPVKVQQNGTVGITYARLFVTDNGDNTTWVLGGTNVTPRTETLTQTYRNLGGQLNPTLANLLDQIGSDNWRLIQKDGNVWIFAKGGGL